jgi:hypothetical protein
MTADTRYPGLIYLASPYNHADEEVRERRFHEVCYFASVLMRGGVKLFCPIAHTHPIAEAGGLPKGWDYWGEYDKLMLAACSGLWIAPIDGWQESVGVAGEVEIAKARGLPIRYVMLHPGGREGFLLSEVAP